jgi:hypothetical protein
MFGKDDVMKKRLILKGAAVVLATLFQVGGQAWAQAPAQPKTCFPGGPTRDATVISSFLANPASLLAQHPEGGPRLASEVRDILASDTAAVGALIGLVNTASPSQQNSIGAGLGQGASLCARIDPQVALQIQQSVASSNNPTFIAAFVGGSNPIDTAAIGTAGGPGAPAGGAPGGAVNTAASTARQANFAPTGGANGTFANGRTVFNFPGASRIGGSSGVTAQSVSP